MKRLKKIRPMFNNIVTTMDVYEKDQIEDGLIKSNKMKGSLKEYQTVLAVGPNVLSIKVGDIVAINPSRYVHMKHNEGSIHDGVIGDNMVVGYKFKTINLDGKECLFLYDQDVDYIIEEFEEIEDSPTTIKVVKPSIIKPL